MKLLKETHNMFKRHPRSLEAILLNFIRTEGLETPLLQKRLIDSWPVVVGPSIAALTCFATGSLHDAFEISRAFKCGSSSSDYYRNQVLLIGDDIIHGDVILFSRYLLYHLEIKAYTDFFCSWNFF